MNDITIASVILSPHPRYFSKVPCQTDFLNASRRNIWKILLHSLSLHLISLLISCCSSSLMFTRFSFFKNIIFFRSYWSYAFILFLSLLIKTSFERWTTEHDVKYECAVSLLPSKAEYFSRIFINIWDK